MIYLVTFILLFLLSYHYDFKGYKENKTLWYITCLLIIICTSGFRYRMGCDSIVYETEYPFMPTLSNIGDFDFSSTRYGRGYVLLTAVAKSITPHFYGMQIIHAIIFNCLLFRFFYKYSSYIFSCVLVYYVCGFFYYNYMILRESLAVVIFLTSWPYLTEKKWIKYYLCCGLAILFHPSATVVCLLPILNLKIFKPFFSLTKFFFIFCIIFYFVGAIVSQKFLEYIRILEIADFSFYADTYESGLENGGLSMFNPKYIVILFIRSLGYPLIVLYALSKKPSIFYKNDKPLINLKNYEAAICFSFYILIINIFIPIFFRFNNFFNPLVWLGIATVFIGLAQNIKLKSLNRYAISIIFIFPLFYLQIGARLVGHSIHSSIPGRIQMLPYTSIFDPQIIKEREQFYGDVLYR